MNPVTLDARESAHIKFALMYAQQFNHGASGHIDLTVIAKLAQMLAAAENTIALLKMEAEPKREFMD